MWLKWLINLVTLGGDLRRKFRELEKERSDESKAVEHMMDRVIDSKKNWETKPPRYTVLKPLMPNSHSYQKEIYGIIQNENFQWAMYTIEQDIFSMLNEASGDEAIEVMGLSKGFSFMRDQLRDIANAYLESTKAEEEAVEID